MLHSYQVHYEFGLKLNVAIGCLFILVSSSPITSILVSMDINSNKVELIVGT